MANSSGPTESQLRRAVDAVLLTDGGTAESEALLRQIPLQINLPAGKVPAEKHLGAYFHILAGGHLHQPSFRDGVQVQPLLLIRSVLEIDGGLVIFHPVRKQFQPKQAVLRLRLERKVIVNGIPKRKIVFPLDEKAMVCHREIPCHITQIYYICETHNSIINP